MPKSKAFKYFQRHMGNSPPANQSRVARPLSPSRVVAGGGSITPPKSLDTSTSEQEQPKNQNSIAGIKIVVHDLTAIDGITDEVQTALHGNAISTYQQVADASDEVLAQVGVAADEFDSVRASALALVDNTSTEPVDLTEVKWIGVTIQSAFHEAGISTYQQVADASDEVLAQVGVAATRYDDVRTSAAKLAEGS